MSMILCQIQRGIPVFIPQEWVYVVGKQSLAALWREECPMTHMLAH